MTELPIVVNMTVDASPTEYDLKAETNQQALSLSNDIVIDTSGQALPLYAGPYTVTPSTTTTTLLTDGKRCNDDIVVSALTANAITQNDLTVDTATGEISSAFTVSRGYSSISFGAAKIEQLDVQARKTVTPTTSSQTAVARGKFTTGAVTVRPIPSPYADVSGVTATANDVLSGKYFVNSSGVLTLGTGTGGSMDTETKDALLECFEHVAWIDTDGQIYYNNLLNALYPLDYITAVYIQSGTVTTDTSLDSLKTDLVVTATFEDGTTKTVTNYTLSGTLTVGTSTVTVTYFTETTTFNVTVSQGTGVQGLWHIGIGINNSGVGSKAEQTDSNDNTRALFSLDSGTTALKRYSGSTKTATYPIEIPAGVTGVTVTCGTDMYAGVISMEYTNSNWYARTKNSWLSPGTTTCTFRANATHWVCYAKKGSGGTTAMNESDVATITFTYTLGS